MNESNGKQKSRLGRNLSALINHSEESLLKAMKLKNHQADEDESDSGEDQLPIETLSLRPLGKDQPDSAIDLPAIEKLPFKPAMADRSSVSPEVLIEESWSVTPAETQQSVLYQIMFEQRTLKADEKELRLGVDQSLTLEIAVQLPLLAAGQSIPPSVAKLHVYLLLFNSETGRRVRMESGTQAIEAGKKHYNFMFKMAGTAAGSWNLSVQIYAALYDYTERRVLRLAVK
jgi:hypothetical protein